MQFLGIKKSGNYLSFRQGNPQVFSASMSLTSVFGMGTGVSSLLSSPENCILFNSAFLALPVITFYCFSTLKNIQINQLLYINYPKPSYLILLSFEDLLKI